MKKVLIVFAILVTAAVSFGLAGRVYAQTVQPPTAVPGYGPGMMGGYGPRGRMGGMMNGQTGTWTPGTGWMHEDMVAALAEKLGLSVDEINTRLTNGERMVDIAAEKGLSFEDFRALMTEARSQALDKAVANGTLTQEQADLMKTRGAGMMGGVGRGQGAYGGCPFATQPAQ